MSLKRLGALALVVFAGIVLTILPASRVAAESFTLVGRVDGGRPSGTPLTLTDTFILISDDSGAPTRYVIDLRWVLSQLPQLDQDDLVSVEIEVLPDGTLVATSVTNQTSRQGSENQGQSTGSREIGEQPNGRHVEDDTAVVTVASATASVTTTATPTLVIADVGGSVTPTATMTPPPTVTRTPSATSTVTPSATITATATSTQVPTSTATGTLLPTGTATETPTSTATPTVTLTSTATVTETPTATPTVTSTATATVTITPTITQTPTPGVVLTTAASSGNVGEHTSLQLNSSGYPVISHYDFGGANLLLTTCSDLMCTSPTTVTIDSTGNVGEFTSLQLDSSGHAIISYYDRTNGNLKLAICDDATCTSASIVVLDNAANDVGRSTSLQLNTSGHPVVSYHDATAGRPLLLTCGNATCSTVIGPETLDATTVLGSFTSLELNSSGHPVVSYYDETNGDLKIAFCSDATCSTPPTLVTLDTGSGNDVGRYPALELNTSGHPVVSYYDASNANLKLATCGDATCSATPTISVLQSTQAIGDYNSLKLNSSGHPVVSYYDQTNGDLRIAICSDATCSTTPTIRGLAGPGNVGKFTSLQLTSSDHPVISYRDLSGADLELVICLNPTCAP